MHPPEKHRIEMQLAKMRPPKLRLRKQEPDNSRAGRRATDAQIVTTRVPVWLSVVVIGLLVLVFVLGGMLIKAQSQGSDPGTEYASIDALQAQLKKNPDNPKLLMELGFEYRKAGMLDDALTVFRRISEIEPKDLASRYHVGSILIQMGDKNQAEVALWDVLEIDPTHAMAAKALGELYASQGRYKSLLVAVEPAAAASPQLADLQYLLGMGREKTGDIPGARRAYWLAVERDPNLAEARAGLDRLSTGE